MLNMALQQNGSGGDNFKIEFCMPDRDRDG
jgi:hypothetical protein